MKEDDDSINEKLNQDNGQANDDSLNIKKDDGLKLKKVNTFVEKLFNENKNIAFGFTFLGRLTMTFYSLHGLFFAII